MPPVATSIEQLLERQWNEGQSFLLQQGAQGDGEGAHTHTVKHAFVHTQAVFVRTKSDMSCYNIYCEQIEPEKISFHQELNNRKK